MRVFHVPMKCRREERKNVSINRGSVRVDLRGARPGAVNILL